MKTLGICVGASSIKLSIIDEQGHSQHAVAPHHGSVPETLKRLLGECKVDSSMKVLVTGTEGRKLLTGRRAPILDRFCAIVGGARGQIHHTRLRLRGIF